jgi:hypothetical protein
MRKLCQVSWGEEVTSVAAGAGEQTERGLVPCGAAASSLSDAGAVLSRLCNTLLACKLTASAERPPISSAIKMLAPGTTGGVVATVEGGLGLAMGSLPVIVATGGGPAFVVRDPVPWMVPQVLPSQLVPT